MCAPLAAKVATPQGLVVSRRIQKLWEGLLRGVGGVCVLKVRYKGKSFK